MNPRFYLMTTHAVTLSLVGWLASSSIAQENRAQDKKATSVADTSDPESWRERYAYSIGIQAYVFGFPYINLPTYRWKWVTQAPPPGPSQEMTPYAAINTFFHFRSLADASYRGGGGPNNDTFYSSAWIDLKDGPVILSHPELGSRYFLFQIACIDGDNFAAVGSRPTGSKAGNFAIIGPGWKGVLPPGITELPRSRSNSVYLLGRTLVDGPADAEAVRKLQDQYALSGSQSGSQSGSKPSGSGSGSSGPSGSGSGPSGTGPSGSGSGSKTFCGFDTSTTVRHLDTAPKFTRISAIPASCARSRMNIPRSGSRFCGKQYAT